MEYLQSPNTAQYGGLVSIEDYAPTKFSELISYKKTSISPLEAFIAKDMTSVLNVVEDGNGDIPANFRTIPGSNLEKAKEIIESEEFLKLEKSAKASLEFPSLRTWLE